MFEKRFDKSIEEKWQKHWAENETYKFAGTQDPRPIYSIDTPPPFTSGELHMGHVLSYSYFDFVARYKRMQGFNVYYPQGWDTQGFPTEVRVEKKHGRLPAPEFRQKCIEWTEDMITKMKAQMDSLGFSPDWNHTYRTMDPDYHRKVQLSLLEMLDKKLLYRDKYPVYWCPKCVSAIAKAELDDVDKDGTIHNIKFEGPNKEELMIATTRPELLPACVAVLFHPEDDRYKDLDGKKIKTALGKEVLAIADPDVDKEFGTGLLMVCTFGDKMDVVWMNRYKLPLVDSIDQYGRMQNSGKFDGLKVKEAKEKILEKLKAEGKLIESKPLKQTVKVHDRCKTPVELIPSLQWFADIRTTGSKIKAQAQRIKWVPDFGINYLIDWVEGAEWDWVISRQRVFGTPLPFYFCEKCGEVQGANADDLPFYPEKAKEKTCSCKEKMKPETSTCDCWVDSSITPLVIAGWPDEKEKMLKLYPSSLRPQGVEIVRTWAFYTIYRSGVALTSIPPFETILLNGNVLAPDGKKMSKSIGNIISPTDLLRDYPADAVRQWAAMSGAMAKDRPFSYEDIKFAKSFLTKVWNASKLIQTATEGYIYKPGNTPQDLNTIDRWIIGRMNQLIKEYTEAMEVFEFHRAVREMQDFFWHEFCDFYLEYVKHRIYGENEESKDNARFSLLYVLHNSLRLLAPISPHISDEIHAEIFKSNESIHQDTWPAGGEADSQAIEQIKVLNAIVSEIRQAKARNKLPQNAELEKVRITLEKELSPELEEELKLTSKIKELEKVKGEFNVSL
jgi:valyl-tRNA synthetase